MDFTCSLLRSSWCSWISYPLSISDKLLVCSPFPFYEVSLSSQSAFLQLTIGELCWGTCVRLTHLLPSHACTSPDHLLCPHFPRWYRVFYRQYLDKTIVPYKDKQNQTKLSIATWSLENFYYS